MKQILPYLLLLACIPALAQKNTKLKINIKADSSRSHNIKIGIIEVDTIRFYKLPEDTLAFTISPEVIRESFVLKHIPVGTYRVTYKNIFMASTTHRITLLKNHLNEISLYVDSLDSYPQHTLARLHDKDSILLTYRATSCDGFDTASITITRDKEHFIASIFWNFFEPGLLLKERIDNEPSIRSVILTDQQIKSFVKFENELLVIRPFIEDNGVEHVCTTKEKYAVKSNYFNIEKSDRACRWNGFYWLKAALFGRLY